MRKLIALAVVAIASQVVSASAGEAVASSKEVVAPSPPPPLSYFRSNEFSLGLFASYGWTYNNNRAGIGDHAWGGGIDGQYFPLQYLGVALEGDFFNEIPGDFFGSTVTANVILANGAVTIVDRKYRSIPSFCYGETRRTPREGTRLLIP